ncbi:MAG: ribosome maturation factor RimP [Acidimicrobiales bacterium]
MAEAVAEALYSELSPVVGALGLELVDVELSGATVRVTVDRDDGVDLDALSDANRAVSRVLDRADPLPGRYTLEVSSPGLERRLRTPVQFARAVGETVSVRLLPGASDVRRLQGRLVGADERGVQVDGPEVPGGSAHLAYCTIERARTVFEWGAKPAPAARRSKAPKGRERATTS